MGHVEADVVGKGEFRRSPQHCKTTLYRRGRPQHQHIIFPVRGYCGVSLALVRLRTHFCSLGSTALDPMMGGVHFCIVYSYRNPMPSRAVEAASTRNAHEK